MSRRFNRAFVMKTNFPMSVSSAGLKEFKEKNRTDDLNDPPSLALIGAMERDPQTGLDYFCVYLLRVDVRRGGISDVRICDITRVQNEATKGDTNASMVLDELLNKRNWAIFNSYSKSFEKRPQHENHYEIQSEKRLERRLP